MAKGVEHFFKMFITISISSLENSVFSSLAIFFFDWVVCFFDVYLFESSSTIFSDDIFL